MKKNIVLILTMSFSSLLCMNNQMQLNQRLIKAIQQKNTTDVHSLLKQGADANARGKCFPVLHIAAKTGMYNMVEDLLKHGADINASDIYGSTVLFNSINKHNTDEHWSLVPLFIQCGVDINKQNKYRKSALAQACAVQHYPTVKSLLKHGAMVDKQTLAITKKHLVASLMNNPQNANNAARIDKKCDKYFLKQQNTIYRSNALITTCCFIGIDYIMTYYPHYCENIGLLLLIMSNI